MNLLYYYYFCCCCFCCYCYYCYYDYYYIQGLAKKAKYLQEAADIVKKENDKKAKLESDMNKLHSKIERLKGILLFYDK